MTRSVDGDTTDERSAVERTADQIRERIKYGRLAPGQRIIEADLIAQLRVSRGTVRAAFGQLATEGILSLERNRGARVRLLQPNEVRDLYELRATLEGRAAGLTAERIELAACREDMIRLRFRNRDFHDGGNFADYWNFNAELHGIILGWCGNDMLRQMAEQTRTLTYHYHLQAASRGDSSRPVSIDCASAQHENILTALLDGDSDAAEQAMRGHVRDNGLAVVSFLEAEQTASPARSVGRG